jgi:PTS system nitrogen regulatory IIA component
MKIKDFLTASHVAIDVRANDKAELLRDLAVRAGTALNLPPNAIASELQKRDDLGSTGIGSGVSIPHARLRELTKAFGLLVRLKEPIEFDAVDGQPVDIVFMLLLPAASQLDQLNALAAVARRLRDREVLHRLRKAKDSTELYQAVAE